MLKYKYKHNNCYGSTAYVTECNVSAGSPEVSVLGGKWFLLQVLSLPLGLFSTGPARNSSLRG